MVAAAVPNSPLDISVVIPTYNRCATLLRALEAYARQTLAPDRFEIIVADDREFLRNA